MIRNVAIGFLAIASIAQAQWVDSDGVPITDIRPKFKYYSVDDPEGGIDQYGIPITAGSFTLINSGPNGVVDSLDNSTRLGDDTGFIAMLISTGETLNVEVASTLGPFSDGIAWAAPAAFGGDIQLSGNAISASFLPVSEAETALFKLPAGEMETFINNDGMITIEVGTNDSFGQFGRTLFAELDPADTQGIFTIVVPEPTSFALIIMAAIAGIGFGRRI